MGGARDRYKYSRPGAIAGSISRFAESWAQMHRGNGTRKDGGGRENEEGKVQDS